MGDRGLTKVPKSVRPVIMHLQWLLLATLSGLGVPGIGCAMLNSFQFCVVINIKISRV
jgi:hypothetical protein